MKFLKNLPSRLFLAAVVERDLHHRDARVRYEAVKSVRDLSVTGKCHPHAFNLLVKIYENKDEAPRIRGEALDGIWRTSSQWLPAIPGVEILEETVNQLIALFDQNWDGKAFTDHSIRSEPVRAIGVRLEIQGGFDLMLLACVRFQLQRPMAVCELNELWYGFISWPKFWSSYDFV